MLIKIFIVFLFFNLVLYMCKSSTQREQFRSGRNKFFILHHNSKDNMYINDLPEYVSTIGYKNNEDKSLFKQLYKLHNNDDREFEYIKMDDDEIDLTSVDILLYVNDAVYLSDYVLIDYYSDDLIKRKTYLRDYEFVLHNDISISVFVILISNHTHVKKEEIVLDPRETTSTEYNFEIEYGINGKYRELGINTNEITLYQNKIADLKVMIGDKVLLKNQRYPYMNGVYEVTEINKYIRMMNDTVGVLPKNEVCIDENLEEHVYYKNKQSCEFKNNYIGEEKEVEMTWDARCRRNMECPFFDYDNEYGGGCQSGGYCEMPYNVKQISFTKYKND